MWSLSRTDADSASTRGPSSTATEVDRKKLEEASGACVQRQY